MVNFFIDESYFKDQKNLNDHYDKHILKDFDYDFQMDEMAKEIYNELSNKLSTAYAAPISEADTQQIIGYVAQNDLIVKFDKESNLCVCYDPVKDSTISLYKTNYQRFNNKLNSDSPQNKEFKYKSDIPEKYEEVGTFDYENFIKEFKIEHRKEFAINPKNLRDIWLFIPNDKFETILKIYSKNTLKRKGNARIKLINIERTNLKTRDLFNAIEKITPFFGNEIKFKILGYFHNNDIEALKIKLLSELELDAFIGSKREFYLILSSSGDNFNENMLNLKNVEFEPVSQSIKSFGVLGGRRKDNNKIITNRKYVNECLKKRFVKMLKENTESYFVNEEDKFAVDRISPRAKLYTEEIYIIENWIIQGQEKKRYRIITDTLNHKNHQRNHYDEYVLEDEFWELWDIRNEEDSGYNLVPKNEIPEVEHND